jgi:hypothetical protein
MCEPLSLTKDTPPEEAWERLKSLYGWEESATAVFQMRRFGRIGPSIPQAIRMELENFGLDRLDKLEELA